MFNDLYKSWLEQYSDYLLNLNKTANNTDINNENKKDKPKYSIETSYNMNGITTKYTQY